MVMNLFYIAGILGLVLITLGIILTKRKTQNILFLIGGSLLIIYSINIKDIIFIILETIFTLVATYNLIKKDKRRK